MVFIIRSEEYRCRTAALGALVRANAALGSVLVCAGAFCCIRLGLFRSRPSMKQAPVEMMKLFVMRLRAVPTMNRTTERRILLISFTLQDDSH